jgi:hypothetical protein
LKCPACPQACTMDGAQHMLPRVRHAPALCLPTTLRN